MNSYRFEALGTKWELIFDEPIKKLDKNKLKLLISTFENNYSRFNPQSLVSLYDSEKKSIQSQEFLELLNFGKKLEIKSEGYFTLQAGKYLSKLGYGTGKQNLDFGAYGKGWLIDIVAQYLKENSFTYFLINAGGDIFATKKADESSWTVALEHPQDSSLAIGTIQLKNQSISASSPFKRKWKTGNHLINGNTGSSITEQKAVFTLATEAKKSDAIATILNITPINLAEKISHSYNVEFLIIENNRIYRSPHFTGTLF